MIAILVPAFFVIAALYASVGFGGGSSYTAILMLMDLDFRLVPIISLTCNLIVVTGSVIHFARAGRLRANVVLPFTILSIPMAWLGGVTPIDKQSFTLVLGLALLASGVALLLNPQVDEQDARVAPRSLKWIFGISAGGALGFLAGLVGIGGGIFLAPALYLTHVVPARLVAATASIFILVNSAAGLVGQWLKLGALEIRGDLADHFWLFPAVLLGGQLGSRAGIRVLSPVAARRLTAVLVIFVAGRLLFRWYTFS